MSFLRVKISNEKILKLSKKIYNNLTHIKEFHSQKWMIPFMSYETIEPLVLTTLTVFACSSCFGWSPNDQSFF